MALAGYCNYSFLYALTVALPEIVVTDDGGNGADGTNM